MLRNQILTAPTRGQTKFLSKVTHLGDAQRSSALDAVSTDAGTLRGDLILPPQALCRYLGGYFNADN
jgi:hypothetical protein